MACDRCHGLLVQDHCYDLLDNDVSLTAWRCIACGNIIDSVILKNRLEQFRVKIGNEQPVLSVSAA
jgi:hypothetical protein